MRDDKLTIATVVIVAVVIGGLVSFGLGSRSFYQRQYLTQRICDRSHAANSGKLEQACADAQRENDTEYMCQNLTPTSFCWTEVK